ncbi:MAG: energy transducer TonB [Acidobacteriia bacterium]|nr:energy transducer TonB [Terriglobia bacterium]
MHGIVIALLFLLPSHEDADGTTAYKQLIQAHEHKLIWYNFQKKLPDVQATQKVGNSPEPRGKELSKQTIIAASPNPVSSQQFIWRPIPKLLIPQDLPLPNLIVRTNTSLPPPPPTEVKRKLERPATEGVRSPTPNNSPPNPKGDVNHAPSPESSQPPKPRKAFVPPVQQARSNAPASMLDAPVPLVASLKTDSGLHALQLKKALVLPPQDAPPSRSALPAAVLDAPDASVGGSGGSKMQSSLPAGLGAPSLSQGIAPPPNGPTAQTAGTGNGAADIAIASLHPGDRLGQLPDGVRPGQFSKAPALGEPSTGEGGGSGGLAVPGLSVREARTRSTSSPDFLNGNRKTVLYAETVRSVTVSTMSVALRPSSRTIPAMIDARFQGRSVYTMVIPIENFPDYGGDWILWFADREQKPGDTSDVRSPIPFRKHELVDAMIPGGRTERRLQIVAVLKRDGRLDGVTLLRRSTPAVEQAVIQDLQSWEFKPATRAGAPVDVDVVFEIPFNLTTEVAGAR